MHCTKCVVNGYIHSEPCYDCEGTGHVVNIRVDVGDQFGRVEHPATIVDVEVPVVHKTKVASACEAYGPACNESPCPDCDLDS
jgi:hypothetical protein